MTLRYRLLMWFAVCIAMPLPAAAESQQPDGSAALGDLPMKAICGPKAVALSRLLVPGSTPRFILHAGGDLELGPPKSSDGVFSFDDFKEEAIARITEVVGVAPRIWCSRVTARAVYEIPDHLAEGKMLRVQLYVASDPTPQLAAEREALLSAAQLAERKAVHRVGDLQQLVDRLATIPLGEPITEDMRTFVGQIRDRLKQQKDDWSCLAPKASGIMASAICDEIGKISNTLEDVGALLRSLSALSESYPGHELSLQYYEQLRALALAVDPQPSAQPLARTQQCNLLGKLRWLDHPDMPRLAAQASVPIMPWSRLELVPFDGTLTRSGLSVTNKLGMIVSRVPVGTKLSFASRLGKSLSADPATVFQVILSQALGALPSRPGQFNALADNQQFNKKDADISQLIRDKYTTPSLICNNPSDRDYKKLVDDVRSWLVVDEALAPMAPVETVSHVFDPFDGKKTLTLVTCAGESCSEADGDKSVRGRVSLTPDRTGSLTLFAEVTFGLGLYGSKGRRIWKQGPFAIQNAPAFEAADRGDGPDQLFELAIHGSPRNAVSTGLILGKYLSDHWLVGGGPALTVGGASGAFSQWNARIAYRWTDSGAYVTFGPSVRFLSEPVDFDLHDRVSVTKSMTGTATAPPFRTSLGAELQFDIGLGIDIGTLGSAVADTLKSFGGGK